MTNKILEAVKALGGDLGNIKHPEYSEGGEFLTLEDEWGYCVFMFEHMCDDIICTVSEFNTYAAEWLKEAYMHNAALDCGWDIDNRYGTKYIVSGGCICVIPCGCTPQISICTEREFNHYCAANKPKVPSEKMKRALDEAIKIEVRFGSDSPQWNGQGLPPVGLDCEIKLGGEWLLGMLKAQFGNRVWISTLLTGDKVVPSNAVEFRPIKSPRDKAIEAISRAPKKGMPDSVATEIYNWLKSLTPEQKREVGL